MLIEQSLKMFAWRNELSGQIVAVSGRDKYEAAEALCNTYPEEEAGDFHLIACGEVEFMEMLADVFGGIVVLVDTIDA